MQVDRQPQALGKVIRHCRSPYRDGGTDYEISIPFSEAFKARLFSALQRASEENDLVIYLAALPRIFFEPSSILSLSLSLRDRFSPVGALKRSLFQIERIQHASYSLEYLPTNERQRPPTVVRPTLSVSTGSARAGRQSPEPDIARSQIGAPPLNSSSIIVLLTPPPVPGTVVFFSTFALDDPGGPGVVHVLAVEETAPVGNNTKIGHHRSKAMQVMIKIHILVSINVPCVVHWGLLCDRKGSQWIRPDPSLW